jgi:hypothetical protein
MYMSGRPSAETGELGLMKPIHTISHGPMMLMCLPDFWESLGLSVDTLNKSYARVIISFTLLLQAPLFVDAS